jgi:hypothetical protein
MAGSQHSDHGRRRFSLPQYGVHLHVHAAMYRGTAPGGSKTVAGYGQVDGMTTVAERAQAASRASPGSYRACVRRCARSIRASTTTVHCQTPCVRDWECLDGGGRCGVGTWGMARAPESFTPSMSSTRPPGTSPASQSPTFATQAHDRNDGIMAEATPASNRM